MEDRRGKFPLYFLTFFGPFFLSSACPLRFLLPIFCIFSSVPAVSPTPAPQSHPIMITILSLPCLLVVENRAAMTIAAASRQRRQRQAIGELVGGGDSGVIRAISGDIPKAWSLGNINPKVNQLISLVLIFNFVDFG